MEAEAALEAVNQAADREEAGRMRSEKVMQQLHSTCQEL